MEMFGKGVVHGGGGDIQIVNAREGAIRHKRNIGRIRYKHAAINDSEYITLVVSVQRGKEIEPCIDHGGILIFHEFGCREFPIPHILPADSGYHRGHDDP
jgi:hypothetical protein